MVIVYIQSLINGPAYLLPSSFVREAGAHYGLRALDKFGKKGVNLPNVKGKIDVIDHEVVIEDGALVIAGNLVVKYVTSTRCGMLTCGILFEASDPFVCMSCDLIDNEGRRHGCLYSAKWQDIISVDADLKGFCCVEKAWELHLGNGSM